LLVLAFALIFSPQGFNSYRAESHLKRACLQLWGIGSTLNQNNSYGQGINLLMEKDVLPMQIAEDEAIRAASADNRRYAAFESLVLEFGQNMRGADQVDWVWSPYELWNTGIAPWCNKEWRGQNG
jgi:hypothetical protein